MAEQTQQATQHKKEIPAAVLPARRFLVGPLEGNLESGYVLVSLQDKNHKELVYEVYEHGARTLRRLPLEDCGWKQIEMSIYKVTKMLVPDKDKQDKQQMFFLDLVQAILLKRDPFSKSSKPYDRLDKALNDAGITK